MKNGERFVVTTRWGTFSLDEGAYQDFLAGNHWIGWKPRKPAQQRQMVGKYTLAGAVDHAIALRDQAEKIGVLATLRCTDVHDALVLHTATVWWRSILTR